MSNEEISYQIRMAAMRSYPQDVLQRFYDTVNNALNSRAEFLTVIKRYRSRTGFTPAQLSAKKFRKQIETDRWYAERVLKERGLFE